MKDITVARWLIQTMENNGYEIPEKIKTIALEYEIIQMKDAWLDGYQKAKDDIICDTFSTFNKFYQKTYQQ